MLRLLAAFGMSCLIAWPALADRPSQLIVFGDSLSDTGNIPALTDGLNFPPSPPYADNRFSNGPVFSELLPGLLGFTFDPSLNFAVGGALTGTANLGNGRTIDGLPVDPSDIMLPGIATQVDSFLAEGGRLAAEDLVIIYGGANDIAVASGDAVNRPVDEIPALIAATAKTAVDNLAQSVRKLHAAGGETFILPNLPDLGATPSYREAGAASRALGTSFTVAHNLALRRTVRKLRRQADATIILFNINALFKAIVTRPSRFGITNTVDPCLDIPSCAFGNGAAQDQYLFFDSLHPTTAVHQRAAEILARTIRWRGLTNRDVQLRLINSLQ